MLRSGPKLFLRNIRNAREPPIDYYKILNVRKNASLKEITTSYFELAKVNHPDHGGEEAVFMSIHKAYREVKKSVKGGAYDFEEAELSNRVPPEDAELFFGCDDETSYWNLKKEKIRALLGEQKFAIKGKGDPWSGFLYRIIESPHMTDGYTEFYCLYLQNAYYSKSMNKTVLELWDFLIDKNYYVHLDEKLANKYEFDFEDEEDLYVLITLDGIYKQIYVGRDIPINFSKSSFSVQPVVQEVVEDIQWYLES